MKFNALEEFLFLLAAVGPLKVTIVCAAMTANAPAEFLKKVALRSVVTAAIVCLVFAVMGEAILRVFKVSVPAFQIGGGIIVLLFALDMVVGDGGHKSNDSPGAATSEPSLDIATYPLAIPLMASVSGLVAIVSLLAQDDGPSALLFLTIVIVAIMALNYLCLRACQHLVRAAGPATLLVVGKMMGVILTAMAVELALTGLIGLGIVARPAGPMTDAAATPKAQIAPPPSSVGPRASSRPAIFADPIAPIDPIRGSGTVGFWSLNSMHAAGEASRDPFGPEGPAIGATEGVRRRTRTSRTRQDSLDVGWLVDEGRGCLNRSASVLGPYEVRPGSGLAGS